MTDENQLLREAFESEMRCHEIWGHRSLVRKKSGRYANWCVDLMWDVWKAAQPAIQQTAQAAPDDVRKDAERYRWLKDKGGYTKPDTHDPDGESEFRCYFWTQSYTLDDAVDAAINGAAKEQQ